MQQEQKESYIFSSYIIYLWRKRFLIVLGTILCMGLTAVYVQFVAKEKFRSFSQIMIKEHPDFLGMERYKITPVSYQDLLLNEDLLRDVRDEYAETCKIHPENLKIEKFKTAFDVEFEVVQDTTIKKEYSPVMILSVDAGTPQNAKTLNDIWLKHFMQRYGDLLSREPDYAKLYFTNKAESVQKELEEKENRFLKLRWELPFKIRQLTAKELLVSPANVQLDYQDQRRSYYKYREESLVNVQVPEPTVMPVGEGLEDRLMMVEQDLATAQAAQDKPQVAQLTAQKEILEKKIGEIKTEIKSLQAETTNMEKEFQSLAREVTGLRDLYQYVIDLKNQAEAEADALHYKDPRKSLERMDIAVLAAPSLPEMRVFPKKSFSCLIAGFVGFLLCCFLVVFDKFMKESRALVEGSEQS
jgi:LPS O-antigen subunit length determinant protein (WzzB/FepE family)